MGNEFYFYPRRAGGMAINLSAAAILLAIGAFSLYQAAETRVGLPFLMFLILILFSVFTIPALLYNAYALQGAYYFLERDGIRLRWGLRVEEIPMNQVLWIRPAQKVGVTLPPNWAHWPGAVLGRRNIKGGGEIEFLASSFSGALIIATTKRFYAITPENPEELLKVYHRLSELGSLTPKPARSQYPVSLISQVWASKPARILISASLFFSLVLVAWVSLAIPGRTEVYFSSDPEGQVVYAVPALRLFLLPVLNSLIFIIDFIAGLFFYRKEASSDRKTPNAAVLAYILWGGSTITAVLFIIGVAFILGQLD